ncbi:MAG: 23S rRNA (pseudouridine(1915)-N(3))-methyltransferase RlmH [Gammaproteobacteria bacterium]|nr:23S rRNA (pseudouridine(1915)-N(3))-methyltransferase RlmH [Gammaproteobacteria bacterium]NIR98793.1 23S rRNA (pseudouridine(1915)-N(3))-methyltransferase RlmH [Gammaproteobacteria bacterium]NIT64503.1 23S rRNA (pseudouridine(1915)-N(3))-methyltransferase RlmH [Gammaproteobacteria bacterium]NIV21423.1 23S rRNA (pseudouridine(1915)-N(3))-methyltransferase RlmH [Gammaproteobacteria bacterium]NIX11293.1 23S rRNA (pseudouridine(1915)-N(3))-methyltransferase RlmH [Gammaproteobacteria bacterium]
MKIHLIAVGSRMPAWVDQGYEEYARRTPPECALRLTEIPSARRGKATGIERVLAEEFHRIQAAIPRDCYTVALDLGGTRWDTPTLARRLGDWMKQGRDLALIVGGPDGLDARCLESVDQRWSLSPLTLPHGLVRVVVAEQLYRAWTILQGHPYHR